MEYIIYCDESISNGRYFSDFYGGSLVRSKDLEFVLGELKEVMKKNNLMAEVKWTKVTQQYLEKYFSVMDTFFALIKKDLIKTRIMFRQAAQIPIINSKQRVNSYHLLYYQFIKHAFGLPFSNNSDNPISLRIHFDKLPDKYIKNELFINYIYGLQSLPSFEKANIRIKRSNIVEIDSSKHLLLQCTDIVLGAMAFRLNDLHKEKPTGKYHRGKRTIAKELLYKHIRSHICDMFPNFNIGITTKNGWTEKRWEHPYRHWKFTPKEFEIDDSKYKKK